jgi:hypothetical protein
MLSRRASRGRSVAGVQVIRRDGLGSPAQLHAGVATAVHDDAEAHNDGQADRSGWEKTPSASRSAAYVFTSPGTDIPHMLGCLSSDAKSHPLFIISAFVSITIENGRHPPIYMQGPGSSRISREVRSLDMRNTLVAPSANCNAGAETAKNSVDGLSGIRSLPQALQPIQLNHGIPFWPCHDRRVTNSLLLLHGNAA